VANDPTRTTSAQAIADLHRLGFILDDDEVLDLSIGPNAGFWTQYQPPHLHTNDLDLGVIAHSHYDATSTPWQDDSFDVTVWDGPFGYRGTSRLASDATYGLTTYRSADAIDELIVAGTHEALRLARRVTLVKCQDQCVASNFREQSYTVNKAARDKGAKVLGKLYINAYRQQPAGKNQLNIWGYHSVILVLEPGGV
jgi:hypothetical protein